MYFLEYNKAVLKNPNALFDWLNDWFKVNGQKYIDYQKKQLDKGKNKKGEIIGYYSKATEIISGGRKKEGEPYNFQDTGEFFRLMDFIFGRVNNEDYLTELTSADNKTDLLITKYNPFGLFEKTEDNIAKELSKFIKEKIENYGV